MKAQQRAINADKNTRWMEMEGFEEDTALLLSSSSCNNRVIRLRIIIGKNETPGQNGHQAGHVYRNERIENMRETDAMRAALRSPGGPAGTRGRDSNAIVTSPAPGGTAADVSDQERLSQDLALFLSNPTLRSALADGSLDLASYSSTVEAELATLESECIGIYRANAGNLSHLRTEMDECDAVLASLQELLLGFQADLAGLSGDIKSLQDQSPTLGHYGSSKQPRTSFSK